MSPSPNSRSELPTTPIERYPDKLSTLNIRNYIRGCSTGNAGNSCIQRLARTTSLLLLTAAMSACSSSFYDDGLSGEQVPLFTAESKVNSAVKSNGERSFNGYRLARRTETNFHFSSNEDFTTDSQSVWARVYAYPNNAITVRTINPAGFESDESDYYEVQSGYIRSYVQQLKLRYFRTNLSYDADGYFLGTFVGTEPTSAHSYDALGRVIRIGSVSNNVVRTFDWAADASTAVEVIEDNALTRRPIREHIFDENSRVVETKFWYDSQDRDADEPADTRHEFVWDVRGNLMRMREFTLTKRTRVERLDSEVVYEYESNGSTRLMNLSRWRHIDTLRD